MGEREGYMQEDEYIIAASSGETIGSGDIGGGGKEGGVLSSRKGAMWSQKRYCRRKRGAVVTAGQWDREGEGGDRVQ